MFHNVCVGGWGQRRKDRGRMLTYRAFCLFVIKSITTYDYNCRTATSFSLPLRMCAVHSVKCLCVDRHRQARGQIKHRIHEILVYVGKHQFSRWTQTDNFVHSLCLWIHQILCHMKRSPKGTKHQSSLNLNCSRFLMHVSCSIAYVDKPQNTRRQTPTPDTHRLTYSFSRS